MNGGHDIVERIKDGILEIQFSTGQDIHLRTGKDVTTELSTLVEVAYGLDLLGQAFLIESVCLEAGLGMVGNAEVFPTPGIRFRRHLLEGVSTVRGGGVVMKTTLEIGILEQCGQFVPLRRFHFSHAFPQSRRNVLEAQSLENILLGMSLDRTGLARGILFLLRAQAPFAQAQAKGECFLAHAHIVVFRACKVMEGKEELFGRHDPQVRLHAVFETHTRLGIPMGGHLGDSFHRGKPVHDRPRIGGSDEKIEIPHRFHPPAQAPGRLDPLDLG